jgi:hypothetical protein
VDGGRDDPNLDDLRWHWGSACIISRLEPDVWVAQRRDTQKTLRAATPAGLRELILADYFTCPVPRGI